MRPYWTDSYVRLNQAESRLWEDRGPDGQELRHAARALAREVTRATGKPCDILASEQVGGIRLDWIPEEGP